MAKLGTTNIGGGGGIGSDELSVTADKVIEGYTYVGADTDDEKKNGTMPNIGAHDNYKRLDNDGSSLYVAMSYGAHITNADIGYPRVLVPFSAVASSTGLTANKILAGQTALGISGTATSDATATDTYVYTGKTYYSNGVKRTGTMNVQSILSFSAAVYSSTAIAFTWQNPVKGPFSGVIIVGKTGAYPTSISDGTRYYKGYGNNTVASGISSATVSGFTSGTTYYFRAFSYAVKDNAEWVHTSTYTATATTTKGQQTFTSSGIFTVPYGVRSVDMFCVGGGGGGGNGTSVSNNYAGGGGGGGYTTTQKSISVTPGQQITAIVGSGGAAASNGGNSYFTIGGTNYCVANGGIKGENGYRESFGGSGGSGGSGGGGSAYRSSSSMAAGAGGSNGGDGISGGSTKGFGQGSTTRAFGESSNTLYAGGGGGGGNGQVANSERALGGSGGGGNGGDALNGGSAGTANTGGGGGGGYTYTSGGPGYAGGSGICIIRWGY